MRRDKLAASLGSSPGRDTRRGSVALVLLVAALSPPTSGGAADAATNLHRALHLRSSHAVAVAGEVADLQSARQQVTAAARRCRRGPHRQDGRPRHGAGGRRARRRCCRLWTTTATARARAFSPDGSHIVTASSDNTARIWNAATAKEIAVLRGHQWGVSSAALSPDGSRIVTASLDQTARIWDTATAKETVGAARARGLCVARCVQPRRVAHRHGLK